MKYALLLALLSGGGLFYVHQEHPRVWQFLSHTTHVLASAAESCVGKNQAAAEQSAPAPVIDPMQAVAGWNSITTKYGQVIPITRVTAVDAHSVHYESSTGVGSVEISNLPDNVQQSLGYDPVAGQKAEAVEQAREVASDTMAAKAQAVEQDAAQFNANANTGDDLGSPVSDGDYASASSDIVNVSSYIVIDPVTRFVRGDAYWVKRYWDDKHRMERYERQRSERERTANVTHNGPSNGNSPTSDHRSDTDRRNEPNSPSSANQQHYTPTTTTHSTTPAPAPRSAPVVAPAPAPMPMMQRP